MAEAMSRTPAAMPISAHSGPVNERRKEERPCAAGRSVRRFSAYCCRTLAAAPWKPGSARSSWSWARKSGASAACACSRVTPGRSRPNTLTHRLSRSSSPFQPGVIWAFIIIGTNTSVGRPSSTPSKPGAVTPTIVYGCPFTVIERPTAEGSAPNRVAQNEWLSTAAACPPGARSSSSVKSRPAAARTPRTGKYLPETSSPLTRSGCTLSPTWNA